MSSETAKLMLLIQIVHNENLALLKRCLPEDVGSKVINSFQELFETNWNADLDGEQAENIMESDNQQDGNSGIICQKCGSSNNKIINTRDSLESFRVRRRECLACGNRWNTEEIITDKGCS